MAVRGRLSETGPDLIDREEVSEEELRSMVATQESFSDEHRQILTGAFEIADRTLREIVRPRGDVVVLDSSLSVSEALAEMVQAGHSRAPVAPFGDLDQFVGFVHLRDLVDPSTDSLTQRIHDLAVFPETVRVLDALRLMQTRRQQIAVIVNEHGGAEGIVTLEDLLEELVGEIYDEADPDLLQVVHQPDGSLELPGRFPMHDLIDINVDLPAGDYATVAGFVLHRLGRVPDAPGDTIDIDGWSIEVLALDRRAIERVRLSPRARANDLAIDPDGSPASIGE